jgi:hypothetical protein
VEKRAIVFVIWFPAVILLAIIVAAVIGVAVVWQSAMPSVFRWDYGDHHHYNVYRDGYEQGNKLGADYERRGDAEPRGQDLDALARREADRMHVRRIEDSGSKASAMALRVASRSSAIELRMSRRAGGH